MPLNGWVFPATALMAGGLLACAGKRLPAPPAPDPLAGRTGVRVLAPSPGPHGDATQGPSERIIAATASAANELPVYPLRALKAGCRGGIVPVRVHINAEGNVARLAEVPDRPLSTDLCHSAFSAAVQGAVSRWRFAPAFRQTPYPGPDFDRDGRSDVTWWHQEAIAIYVDFEFTFEVVDGQGLVRTR